MEEIEGLIQRVSKVKDGFKPIQAEAENILAQYPTHDSLQLAYRLYESEVHQARMLATIIFGKLAALSLHLGIHRIRKLHIPITSQVNF